MRNVVLTLMVMMLSLSANAVNLAFKFEVTSSGNSMYACNAGLKHSALKDRVCYDRKDLKACNPAACTEGEACNCVCTGGGLGDSYISKDGEYRLDYMVANYAKWTDNGDAVRNVRTVKYTADKNDFRSIFSSREKFGKQLTSLSFNLGSERYGAEYYVDVCFRATQIKYPTHFDNNDTLNWTIQGGVTVTDIGTDQTNRDEFDFYGNNRDVYYTGATYQDLSGLKVKGAVLCKDKSGREAVAYTTNWTNFNDGQLKTLFNKSTQKDLKGCYFRYIFKESKEYGIASVRKWKKQKARICTYSSVNEPLTE